MIRLTVEEMNLLSIYHEGSKAQLMENMTWTRICAPLQNAPYRKFPR